MYDISNKGLIDASDMAALQEAVPNTSVIF
jgi:hypothetical protein